MPYMISGIPVTIPNDGRVSEDVPEGKGGPTASVRMKCAWSQRSDLIKALVGESYVVGEEIIRTNPFQYPDSPNLYCLSVSDIQGFPHIKTRDDGWADFDYAIFTAHFGILPYDLDTYLSINLDISGEFITFPQTTYRFLDGTPTMQSIGRVIPNTGISVRAFKLPYIPQEAVAASAGRVNIADFTIGAYTYPAGTLLFLGAHTEEEWDSIGQYTAEVEYRFAHKYTGWNFYPHPDGSGFALVTSDGTMSGDTPYGEASFTDLVPGL